MIMGILTTSTLNTDNADQPAVVILNAGVIHRVGPNRLWVRLAREFAALGLTTLRFDLSGIGDSEPQRDSISLAESTMRDIDTAMDYLNKSQGIDRFIFVGLCSGACDAFFAACRDPRISGATLNVSGGFLMY